MKGSYQPKRMKLPRAHKKPKIDRELQAAMAKQESAANALRAMEKLGITIGKAGQVPAEGKV